jgi:histidyl-tRNA synthetase
VPPISNAERFLTGVGLAFGMERVTAALSKAGIHLRRPPWVFVAVQNDYLVEQALSFADRLRQHGLCVECHLPRADAAVPIREQIGHASHSSCRFTIIFGMDEWREQKIVLRDMESREQWTITPQTAEKLLAALLPQKRTPVV